jgi:hypothetical protein
VGNSGCQGLLVSHLCLVMLTLNDFVNITDLDKEVLFLVKLDFLEFDLNHNLTLFLVSQFALRVSIICKTISVKI